MHENPQRKQRTQPKRSELHSPRTQERLQKVLASAGIASRRHCEELITQGRVEVDRRVVTKLGTCVDPAQQEIRVDGTPLKQQRHVYFIVNKPEGVVSTNSDPAGRVRVIDLLPDDTRLFTVGRLDRSSEGLILVTNDGELAHKLSHPRYGIPKTYRAKVMGRPSRDILEKLRGGIYLSDGIAHVASLRVRGRHSRGAELEVVLTEGRNREIRRVLARVGHKVLHLRRIAIGPVRLAQLELGHWRQLTRQEVQQLQRFARRAYAQDPASRHSSETRPTTDSVANTDRPSTQASRPQRGRRPSRETVAHSKPAHSKPAHSKPARAKPARREATGTILDYEGSRGKKTAKPKPKRKGKPGSRKKASGAMTSGKAKTGKRGTRRR